MSRTIARFREDPTQVRGLMARPVFRGPIQLQQFSFASPDGEGYFRERLSGGVMVAQGPLEAFVMVRIHAGQPVFQRKLKGSAQPTQIPHTNRPDLKKKT